MNKLALLAIALILCASQNFAAPVSYAVDSDKVVLKIDDKIYGQFLEHICNSIHGGLWGDMFLDGSFEVNNPSNWTLTDGTVGVTRPTSDQPVLFGDRSWSDYEFTCEARRTDGGDAFGILFRAADRTHLYRCRFGGWGNKQHAVEKIGRGGLKVDRVAGTIENGRWYKVRVRCEGPHIQVWLDDAIIADANDSDPFAAGAVGFDVWNGKSEFRNAEVKDLQGKALFKGLPPRSALCVMPAYWQFIGDGIFISDPDDAFNSRVSQCIDTSGTAESALQQGPFCLRKGETYKGSVYMKGSAPQGVTIRFLDPAGKVVTQQKITGITAAWTKKPFTFTPAATCEDATFQLLVPAESKIWVDELVMFSQSSLDTGGFRPDLLKAVADLKPTTIRWPGGCFASQYHWKDAVGAREKRTVHGNVIWEDRDMNQYGTDDFLLMCKKVGAQPIMVANLALGLQNTLDWMEYCNGPATSKWGKVRAQNGHPEPYNIKYWEIDNETWGMGRDKYNNVIAEFAPAMRKAFPGIKVIVCGGYGYDTDQGRGKWDQSMMDANATNFDYISIHYYNGLGRKGDYVDDPRDYEAHIKDIGDRLKQSANPEAKVYCSEYGLTINFDGKGPDWRSGLYTASLLNGFERAGEAIKIGGPALFLRRTWCRSWDNALVNFDHKTWFPGGNYVATKLWRDHCAPNLLSAEGPVKPLNFTATKSADGKTIFLKVVNPEREPVQAVVNISGAFKVSAATMLLVNPGDDKVGNSLAEPHKVWPKPAPGVEHDARTVRFTMPPVSAGVVTVVRAK